MRKVRGKVVSAIMVSAMALSLVACGGTETTDTSEEATQAEEAGGDAEEAAPAEAATPSVDFEDGNFAFVKVNTSKGGADKSELSVEDFNGSKALKATNVDGGNMYVGINVSALLGDSVADLAKVSFDIGTESSDGNFYSSSGTVYTYTGEDLAETKAGPWSVYIDTANPKNASVDVSGFVAGADNYIMISKETDIAADKGVGAQNIYIDNIALLDASGNSLTADTSADFGSPAGFADSVDRSHLYSLTKAVNFEGFAVSADAWAQDGKDMPQEIIDALVPGAVVEIEFTSETGNMWIVMPDAEAGWMRVGVGDADGSGQGYAYVNSAKTIAQVTYEQLAQYCGDDVSKWGARMQCESDGAWSVSSVKVGQAAPNYGLKNAVEFPDFAVKADAWAQDGKDMPQEIIDALVPGSVVEISYKSETGNMWLVMPDATAGWMRVGVGDADGSGQGYAVCDGSKAYVTYEDLAQYCGDDVSAWGARMQCESDGAWEVYGIRVGEATEFVPTNKQIDLGASVSGDGWAQDGVELSADAIAALVPGSYININYTSETGEIWIVIPDAEAGWMRVGVGDYDGSGQGYAIFNGSTCQIPFEMIAQYCGDDVSKWGTRIQFEASTAWSVSGASIGLKDGVTVAAPAGDAAAEGEETTEAAAEEASEETSEEATEAAE